MQTIPASGLFGISWDMAGDQSYIFPSLNWSMQLNPSTVGGRGKLVRCILGNSLIVYIHYRELSKYQDLVGSEVEFGYNYFTQVRSCLATSTRTVEDQEIGMGISPGSGGQVFLIMLFKQIVSQLQG